MQLTARQTQVLEFVRSYIEDHDYGPSERELAAFLEVSREGARRHLEALEVKGQIQRTPGIARSVRVCHPMADNVPATWALPNGNLD